MATIGILGGMGPLATVDLFGKIVRNTPARYDQDHVRIIIDNNPQVPSRIEAILGGGASPLPEMTKSARLLEGCGVDLIVIPCNTAHFWIGELRRTVKTEIVNMIEVTAAHISRRQADRRGGVMLLATAATVRTGLYAGYCAAQGLELIIPGEEEQRIVSLTIDEVKGGRVADNPFLGRLTGLMEGRARQGVTAFVGGCTEVPLVFPHVRGDFELYDPADILARYVVKRALAGRIGE